MMGFRNIILVPLAIAPASNLALVLAGGEQKAAQEPDVIKKVQTLAPLDTFTALIAAGLKNTAPTLQYSEIFVPPTDLLAAQAESLCYETLGGSIAQPMLEHVTSVGKLDGYPRTQPNFMTTIPEVKDFLTNSSQPLKVKISTPIFIYQGTADPTVPKQVTDYLVQAAQGVGTKIHYVTDQDLPVEQKWDHGSVYVNNMDEIVKDVQSLMPIQ